jgi:hypothetical protein
LYEFAALMPFFFQLKALLCVFVVVHTINSLNLDRCGIEDGLLITTWWWNKKGNVFFLSAQTLPQTN